MVHVDKTVPAKTQLEVSVLLNVWSGDKPEEVERSIRSILWQTALPSEILVVSDGPAGEVMRAVIQKSLVNQTVPFRFIETERPRGLWNARNIGIEAARFEVVFLQDADDVMHPKRLEIQYAYMLKNEADICGSWAVEFDSRTTELKGVRIGPLDSETLHNKMLWRNVVPHSSVAVKRSRVISVGGYRDIYLMEDYDLWLRLILNGFQISIAPIPLQALAVDQGLYQRRGGFRFIRSELTIDALLRTGTQLFRIFRYRRLAMRIAYRLAPTTFRCLINQRVLSHNFRESDFDAFLDRDVELSPLTMFMMNKKKDQPILLYQFFRWDPTRTKSSGL